MSVVIRFSKTGRKGERKYRVVVKEKRSKRDGKAIDVLGFYEKRIGFVNNEIDEAKVKEWVAKGAQISPSVKRALESKSN